MVFKKITCIIPFLIIAWSLFAQTLELSGYIGASEFESMRDVATDVQGNSSLP